MSGGTGAPQQQEYHYSSLFAFAYIFNLIIGVGALALPRAFSESGLVLGTLLIVTLAFMSFVTTGYVIEAMAAANAYTIFKEQENRNKLKLINTDLQKADSDSESLGKESAPLIPKATDMVHGSEESLFQEPITPADSYEIDKKFEMGTMASMFFHPIGIILYYICICLYLYGDLAIYVVTIPKSLRTVTCLTTSPHSKSNSSNSSYYYTSLEGANDTFSNSSRHCFGSSHITEAQTYYIYLAITCCFLCPWTFFNLTRSKYIQLLTTILRNVAFVTMILLAIVDLSMGNRADRQPPPAHLGGFPVLFGVSIYSFMCQHSLPGMVTPMKSKKNVFWLTLTDFSLILLFYLILSYTGAFRFATDDLQDIYTLNFFDASAVRVTLRVVLGYYLALFPVFTLSTNFPIISITLRENLKALFHTLFRRWRGDREFPFFVDRIAFPLLAIIPPILVAFGTTNLEVLVSITGSFPGVGVQYIIPAALAYSGRYVIEKKYRKYENKHRSPFGYLIFIVFVLIWAAVCVIFIVIDDAIKIKDGTFTKA